MHLYTGRDPLHVNPVLVQLLKALGPGPAPVLRIGGDSTDSTWWPMRGVIPPGGISYALTKGWLRTTRALAARSRRQTDHRHQSGRRPAGAGRGRGAGDPARESGASTSKRSRSATSPISTACFPGTGTAAAGSCSRAPAGYDLQRLHQAISRAGARRCRRHPLAGPAFAGLGWLGGLEQFIYRGAAAGRLGHLPPLSPARLRHRSELALVRVDSATCSPTAPRSAWPASCAIHTSRPPTRTGCPFRLDELNSASCAGRGVSDTFASALWVLDTLFNLAAGRRGRGQPPHAARSRLRAVHVHASAAAPGTGSSTPSTTGC